MSFTYTHNPASVPLDFVRDRIGDTDPTDALLSDGEIQVEISTQASLLLAAAACAQKIASRFARNVSAKVGNDSEQSSDLFRHYTELAVQLRGDARQGSGRVAVGQMNAVTTPATGCEPDWTVQKKL